VSETEIPPLSDLRAELLRAAQTPDRAERTLEVVAVVELVAAPMGIHPVIVGGMAVYFWTASDAFLTYDIDLVMEVPELLGSKLAALGFAKTADGRHWLLEGTEILLEAPSSRLDDGALVVDVTLPSGRTAKVLSRVDILIDRLDEFQATGHEVVGRQILALIGGIPEEELADLEARAPTRRVTTILAAMRAMSQEIVAGRAIPSSDELHEIARTALRAEYAQ
jgi:hypothetical protein